MGRNLSESGEVSCANLLDGFPLAGPSLGFAFAGSRTPTGTVTTGAFHSEFPAHSLGAILGELLAIGRVCLPQLNGKRALSHLCP